MRGRGLPAIIVAVVLGLVLGGAAVAAEIVIPDHSIGLNKLTFGVQAMIKRAGRPVARGPMGPAGPPGPQGPQGPPGPENEGEPKPRPEPPDPVSVYSQLLSAGAPDQELAKIGPLTFTASCVAEGEDTIKGTLTATSSADGVRMFERVLNQGESTVVQQVSVSGGGFKEMKLPIIAATDESQSFALQGMPALMVVLPGGCHFFGTLVRNG